MSSTDFTAPIVLEDRKLVAFTVKPLMFANFLTVAMQASTLVGQDVSYPVLLRRARMKAQVTVHDTAKKSYPLSDTDLAMLPVAAARQIIAQLSEGEGVAGKVITKGDGIGSAVVYALGTPIKVGSGAAIEELEFLASTYGELESVMAEDGSQMAQTVELIKRVAKPPGMLAMPSWGVEGVTMADGMTILTAVLPSFL